MGEAGTEVKRKISKLRQ